MYPWLVAEVSQVRKTGVAAQEAERLEELPEYGCAGDQDEAEQTMRAHIRDGYRMELSALQQERGDLREAPADLP